MPHFSSLFAAEAYQKAALLYAFFFAELSKAACASRSADGASSALNSVIGHYIQTGGKEETDVSCGPHQPSFAFKGITEKVALANCHFPANGVQ
jgi:hypothetical protein